MWFQTDFLHVMDRTENKFSKRPHTFLELREMIIDACIETTEEMYHCVINNLGVCVEEVHRRYMVFILNMWYNKHYLEAYRQHFVFNCMCFSQNKGFKTKENVGSFVRHPVLVATVVKNVGFVFTTFFMNEATKNE